jgi:hypothetical protein
LSIHSRITGMNKKQFTEHLNIFHSGSEISQFRYLTNRKVRKKGYVSQSTLTWYFENGRMGDLLRKVDKPTFENERNLFNGTV